MALQKEKTIIGLFVIGALSLVAIVVILLGSGFFAGKTASFVLYFDSSLRGLHVGSPVYFSGVKVGKVASIDISPNMGVQLFKLPVIIALETQSAKNNNLASDTLPIPFATQMGKQQYFDSLVTRGLRAMLTTASMITGQLVIELVMLDNPEPIDLKSLKPYHGIPQLPTTASPLNTMLEQVQNLPIDVLVNQAIDALTSITNAIHGMEMAALSTVAQETLRTANMQMEKFDVLQTQLILTVAEYGKMAKIINKRLDGLLLKVDSNLAHLDVLTSEDSIMMQEFFMTMESLREMAKAVSILAKLLEREPDSLIFGKGQ